MGLLSFTLGLPFAPVRGLLWLGEVIQQRVEQEMHDPSVARRELEQVEEMREKGEVSAEAVADVEHRVVRRMAKPRRAGAMADPEGNGGNGR